MKYVAGAKKHPETERARRESAAGPALVVLLLFAAVAPALTGCLGMGKTEDAVYVNHRSALSCGGGASGLEAFRESVWPLVRANCTSCHAATLRPFASPDAQTAYTEAVKYTDLDNVASSRFVAKVKDAHCGGYCSNGGPGAAAMTAALTAWKGAVGSCAAPGGGIANNVTTTPQALPSPLGAYVANNAAGGTWSRMRFPLPQVQAGAVFEVMVQSFQTDGYRFKEPRLAAPGGTLYIKNVKILLNGIYNSVNATYTVIENFVNPAGPVPPLLTTAMGYPVLSSDAMIVSQDLGVAQDRISISFEILRPATAASCRMLPQFQSAVLPVMNTYNCYNCHGGGPANLAGNNATARTLFNMTGTDAELCTKALQRTNKNNWMNSMFIRGPLSGDNNHPMTNQGAGQGIITNRADVIPSWVAWIGSEWTGVAGGSSGSGGGVPLTPNYASLSVNVFLPKCGGCHNANTDAPTGMNLNMTTYASIVTNAPPGFMVPGNALGSQIYDAVLAGRMPRGGPVLETVEINAIRDWIAAGALNN
ncbi:MAG TPA: hypothetical protein VM598_05985 [Bdellovibrionota bacterium]|nr:hypothetical protein [Bdellovibrionota bacterium]